MCTLQKSKCSRSYKNIFIFGVCIYTKCPYEIDVHELEFSMCDKKIKCVSYVDKWTDAHGFP
jgi:hypothetical protein